MEEEREGRRGEEDTKGGSERDTRYTRSRKRSAATKGVRDGGDGRSRLKGCTHTEFQACTRYLLGISSRHISVVTHRASPAKPPALVTPARGRLTRDDILFAKRTLPAGCRFLLILCAQEFLSVARRGAQISRRSEGGTFSYSPFSHSFLPFFLSVKRFATLKLTSNSFYFFF